MTVSRLVSVAQNDINLSWNTLLLWILWFSFSVQCTQASNSWWLCNQFTMTISRLVAVAQNDSNLSWNTLFLWILWFSFIVKCTQTSNSWWLCNQFTDTADDEAVRSNRKLLTIIPIEDKRPRQRQADGLLLESLHKNKVDDICCSPWWWGFSFTYSILVAF